MKTTINLIDDLVQWQKEYRLVLKNRKMDLDEKEIELKNIREIIDGIQAEIIEKFREERKLSTGL